MSARIYFFIFLFLCQLTVFSEVSDSLSVKIESYAEKIADEIERAEKNNSVRKNYLFYFNNENNDSISSSGNWIEETGTESNVLTSTEFEDLKNSLDEFNDNSPTGVKLYATIINDFKIYFDYGVVSMDSINTFDLNKLNPQWLNQSKLNEYNRIKEDLNGRISASVLAKLTQREIDVTHLCLYTFVNVRGYEIKNETAVKSKLYFHDQCRYPPSVKEYRELIKQKVNEACISTGKRPYFVIKSLIYAFSTFEIAASMECSDDETNRIEKTAAFRQKYFLSDIEKIASIVGMNSVNRYTNGYCEDLLTTTIIYTEGAQNFLRPSAEPEKNFLKYEWTDKVRLLEENSNYKLYTVFASLGYFVSQDSTLLMAQEIHQRAGLGANDILLFLPYFNHTCHFNSILFPADSYYRIFFATVYVPDESFSNSLRAALLAPSVFKNKLNEVFKAIPKKHYSYYYFINYLGDVVGNEDPKIEENTTNYSSIKDFYFFEDGRKALYDYYLYTQIPAIEAITSSLATNSNPVDEYFRHVHESNVQFFLQHPEPDWKTIPHNLRETKIDNAGCKNFVTKFKREELGSLPHNFFRDGNNQYYHDPVLQVLDAVSIVASVVGADFIVDGVSVAYCGFTGDYENAAMYATFMVVPVLTGGEAGVAKRIANGEEYAYRSLRNEDVLFRTKSSDLYQYTLKELPSEVQQQLALPVCRNVNGEVISRIMSHADDPQFAAFSRHLEETLPDNETLKNLLRNNPEKIDDYFLNYFKVGKGLGEFLEGGILRYANINQFWNEIPSHWINDVKSAFVDETAVLKYTQEDITFYRHCSPGANQISNWFAEDIYSPNQARTIFALPNSNTASRIVKIKVKKGTPYIEGIAADKTNAPWAGPYATGGGKQFYFLSEDFNTFEILDDFTNPN